MTSNKISSRIFSVSLAFLVAVLLIFYGSMGAIAAAPPYEPMEGSPETMGAWYLVPMPPPKDQMQAVHTILLPNGKVLVASGSSNRSRLENGQILNGVDGKKQTVVDNTSLFDPSLSDPDRAEISSLEPDYASSGFERIASPVTPVNGEANDLFCSGHLHLPNGNVLFAGGNRLYYPGGFFQGMKHTNIFDWQTNTWSSAGDMVDGRWYPTLVPLANGKIAIFSGLRSGKFDTNSIVEFYDPDAPPDQAWQAIDLKQVENSPFNTAMVNTAKQSLLLRNLLNKPSFFPDVIDLYPRIFPTPDGRFLISGDGGGKFPLPVPNTTNSFLMSIEENDAGTISVHFDDEQPQRKARNKVYGTALADPNSDDILMVGGIVGTNDIQFGNPANANNRTYEQSGSYIASSVERWHAPPPYGDGESPNGSWDIDKNFLGRPWAMGQAVILPTQEILVLNGGRYGEVEGYKDPLLLTPNQSASEAYTTQSMNSALIPRFYHNNALLLPDARVLAIGGNPNQAIFDTATGAVYRNTGLGKDGQLGFVYPPYPEQYAPAESWQAEIFSPPYLFKPGARPEIVQAPDQLHYGETADISVHNPLANPVSGSETNGTGTDDLSLVLIKLSSNTHSLDAGQRLADLTITTLEADASDSSLGTIEFGVPDNAHLYPPGYYMMFYLNEVGKPSHAKMVQLVG
jgi:hypothetical protein